MPAGKNTRPKNLPPELISRGALDKLRARLKAEGVPLPAAEPDWKALCCSLQEDRGLTEAAAGELARALDECQPERIDVIVCDAKVQCVQSFEPGDVVTIDAKGGGGTDFRPVFDIIEDPPRRRGFGNREGRPGEQEAKEHALEEFDEPPVCVVYLTDLDGSFPAKAPEYPVLWCVPPGVNANRNVPFGEIVAVK